MQAFLGDLSSTTPQGHDRRMKDWMKQIRDVTYDIEDCVDDFAHRLSGDPGDDVCCAFIVSSVYEVWTWRPRRDIASNIAQLKVRAEQIGERRTRYGVENPKSSDGQSSGAATGFQAADNQQMSLELVGTKEPVGVDKEMKELGKWVTLQQEQQQQQQQPAPRDPSPSSPDPTSSSTDGKKQDQCVLSIVGFGGVGKTTIATALYQKFGDQFDCRAMVTVSQSSDIDVILRIILSQVMPQSTHGNGQQGSSDGGTSEKNRVMAAIGSLWDTVVPKGHQDDEQRGGSTLEMTQALEKHLEDKRYNIFSS
jgi:disease resistance protein RPM1